MDNEYDRQMAEFSESWEQILDDEEHPNYELACVISNWITWLWDKPRELATLDAELAEVKFAAWRELLDFHLWNEPSSLEEALVQMIPLQAEDYLTFFKRCQDRARCHLKNLGYERICPQPGELVVPGEAICSGRTEITSQQELHGRVFSVLLGKAGYRKNGKILTPAEVVIYRYQPDS